MFLSAAALLNLVILILKTYFPEGAEDAQLLYR